MVKNEKGFTLLEIVVVIGIIALLAVFLIPRIYTGTGRAKELQVKSGAKEIAQALEEYANDHSREYPADNLILGGSDANDILIKNGYLKKYPRNPFIEVENANNLMVKSKSGNNCGIVDGQPIPGGDEGTFCYAFKGDSGKIFDYVIVSYGEAEKNSTTNAPAIIVITPDGIRDVEVVERN